MQNLKQHIIFKIVTLSIVIALLTPSVVKFSHLFEHHKHEVCLGEFQDHLHTLDIDCDFYKFKLNTPFTFSNFDFVLFSIENNHQINTSQYSFLSNYQKLHFSLRAPPINS